MTQLKLQVPNISCAHCTKTIEQELDNLRQVSAVSADPQTKEVVIEHDGEESEICAKLVEIGFPPA